MSANSKKQLTVEDINALLGKSKELKKVGNIKLSYTPLHSEFIVQIDDKKQYRAYDPEIAVELFNTGDFKSWQCPKELLSEDVRVSRFAVETVRRTKNKKFVIIMENATEIKVYTVYARAPKKEDVNFTFNMLKAKEKLDE